MNPPHAAPRRNLGWAFCMAATVLQLAAMMLYATTEQKTHIVSVTEYVASAGHRRSSPARALRVIHTPPYSFGTCPSHVFSAAGESAAGGAVRSEAFCDCYDGSCTLHLKYTGITRVAPGAFTIRAMPGSDIAALRNVTTRCKNAFPYCDYRDTSIFCAGIRVIVLNDTMPADEAATMRRHSQHVFVHARALAGQFYHGLLYPRGMLLTWAMLQLAAERICGVNDSQPHGQAGRPSWLQQCIADLHVRTTVMLFSDFHYPSDSMKAQGIAKFPSLVELEDLLGVPEAVHFHKNFERPAKWVTIGNRILSYGGPIRDKIVRAVQFVREAIYQPRGTLFPFGGVPPTNRRLLRTHAVRQIALDERVAALPPPERPAPDPAILLSIRPRKVQGAGAWVAGSRNRGIDEAFKAALVAGLPNATGRPVHVHDRQAVKAFSGLRFREQLAVMMTHTFFVADEGAHLAWMALTNPGAVWITVYDYTPGIWTDNMRYHIRTWLLRRDCRLIVYVTTAAHGGQAGVDTLLREAAAAAPAAAAAVATGVAVAAVKPEIVVIGPEGVTRCDSVASCANALDFSLVVDMRGMYPLGV